MGVGMLKNCDNEVYNLVQKEANRQESTINLIASENYTPLAVREATGSILTNKYAEGYPGKRYYAGCEVVDALEKIAIERACVLFGAEHANVQPHAGSQANMAVYTAILKPGDTILSMNLAAGGHLTHGHCVNFSGMLYTIVPYTVEKETGLLNYDTIAELARKHKPKLIIAGASAYSRILDFEAFYTIAQEVGAYLMVDMAHIAGLVAAGVHPSPVAYADFVTSTTHKTLRGPRGGFVLCKEKHKAALDRAVFPGIQGGPCMNVIAAKAVAFKCAQQEDFKMYQQQVVSNAQVMAREFIQRGYTIVSGATDNHLFVIDLSNKDITGRAAELLLESIGITVSRSCTPFDCQPAWVTSGIRIGTPAMTTRGMTHAMALAIVNIIDRALMHKANTEQLRLLGQEVLELAKKLKYDNS